MVKRRVGGVLALAAFVASWFWRGTVESWFFDKVLGVIEPNWSWAVEYGPPALLACLAVWLLWDSNRVAEVGLFKQKRLQDKQDLRREELAAAASVGGKRMPITELRAMAAARGWDFVSDKSLHILDFTDGLRQAGLDDEVTLWGRPNKYDSEFLVRQEPLNKIPAEHWKDCWIDGMGILGEDNYYTRSYLPGEKTKYLDLHVARDQAIQWLATTGAGYRGRRKP